MARPTRIEFAGAVYHVCSRSEAGEAVFVDDIDRQALLTVLGQAMQRFDAQVLAFCLMPDQFNLLLFTRQANLSRLMRHINGVYTQGYNRRHGTSGHLFQGRFKAVLVDREALLLDACRYVELNPQRVGLVRSAADWPWSSCRAHLGLAEPPAWLDVDGLHSHLLERPALSSADHRRAAERYARLLAADPNLDLWQGHLRQQIFLGDAKFAERMQAMTRQRRRGAELPRSGRQRSFAQWLGDCGSREQALYRAHTEGGISMTALAGELGLSVSRISRLIKGVERGAG
ncbi:transposase [Roseateles microcysteis]|uniref:transposase n=1 Tax=Roseateles microcysteis TaxID=3119057 RepID=UPI002FE58038